MLDFGCTHIIDFLSVFFRNGIAGDSGKPSKELLCKGIERVGRRALQLFIDSPVADGGFESEEIFDGGDIERRLILLRGVWGL